MKALIIEDDHDTAEIICPGLQVLWPEVEAVSTRLEHKGITMIRSEAREDTAYTRPVN